MTVTRKIVTDYRCAGQAAGAQFQHLCFSRAGHFEPIRDVFAPRFISTSGRIIAVARSELRTTHLDSSFIIVIDRAGHNVGGRVGFRDVIVMGRLLGVFLDVGHGGEGRPGGPEHGEVSGVGVGMEGGGRVEQGIGWGKRKGGSQFRTSSQLVNVILKLLKLLKVSGLKGGGVKEGGTGGS